MRKISEIGSDWVVDSVGGLTDHVDHITPSQYNEENRYLPESVTNIPGYIRYAVNPFMREIVDCFDINSPVREVNLKKGVQITYSTVLESGALYFMGHIKTLPIMYLTADKELATARIENNFLPMLNNSDMGHIIRSSDEGNTRKTGKTGNHLQFAGGGYLVPFGARNADKMRSYSICVMLKDEIDAWPDKVGKDGDPDALSDDRCSGYWERRKIFRGSTPLIKGSSKIEAAYLRGDQRKYMVKCKSCKYPQALRWSSVDKETGIVGGFQWDLEDGVLVLESVRYCCQKCGTPHYEHDKERLFSPDHGAEWVPTAKPAEPNIRSYHLPALYSPIGLQPWYKSVSTYLSGFDPVEKKVRDIGKYQVFYNNILAEPFEITGSKIRFTSVSAHRRAVYRLGSIPNEYAKKFSGSVILFLTCQVDVHKNNLAVSVMGWCRDAKSYVIDYWRFEVEKDEDDCSEISSPVWGRLRELIEETSYTADDGKNYKIAITLVDAGYANDTVTTFCSDYSSGVYPILGRDRAAKNQTIKEFGEFTTQSGTVGYRILVDHYKDRLAPVLRRDWEEGTGTQKPYHFNAPIDILDKQLTELTVESRKERKDEKGIVSYFWHRPGNARNELWDLLVYGHAAVEIMAWSICIQKFELDTVDWPRFWDYVENDNLYYTE
jgi:phage terminase large subunit GpA-like protein